MKKVNSKKTETEKSQDKLISLGALSREELKALLGGRAQTTSVAQKDIPTPML